MARRCIISGCSLLHKRLATAVLVANNYCINGWASAASRQVSAVSEAAQCCIYGKSLLFQGLASAVSMASH